MNITGHVRTSDKYSVTLDYLFSLQRVGIKYSLDNIQYLLRVLGNPHQRIAAVHIVGTNGKGSVAAMISAIGQAAGLKMGLYTSPHLVDFRERIRINDELIPKEFVVEFTRLMRRHIEAIRPSFFEVTTAMAFQYFAEQKPDMVILEAGMGGRLDSTNVVRPLLTLITPIGVDHQNYLGNTLAAIAREKAGVLKSGVPAITIEPRPEVRTILAAQAETVDTFLDVFHREHVQVRERSLTGLVIDIRHPEFQYRNLRVNFPATYQALNSLLAVAAIHRLPSFFPSPERAVRAGLADVRWRGRMDVVGHKPVTIVDVSHNPEGLETTLREIANLFPHQPLKVIMGLQADKDFQTMGQIVARYADTCFVVPLNSPRQLPPQQLVEAIRAAGGTAEVVEDVKIALNHLEDSTEGVWLITGSHYLAGAAYRILENA